MAFKALRCSGVKSFNSSVSVESGKLDEDGFHGRIIRNLRIYATCGWSSPAMPQ
jgi:hypothetical protein